MPANDPSRIPVRTLLSEQAARCIRERIANGEWQSQLPSESALCRTFQVSRVTLRRALQELLDEGILLEGGRGIRHRIATDFVEARRSTTGRVVRVLAPFSSWKMGAISHAILEGLSQRVATRDFRVEFESRPQLFESHRPKELEHLVQLPETAGWVLFFSTAPMQEWFAQRKTPCILAGRRHQDLGLSCVYPDIEAVARHAAGLLVSRGHRRIAHLMARHTSLGDRLAGAVFGATARELGAEVQLVEYDDNPHSICRMVSSVIASRPSPTVCYLTCPEDGVTALCHAMGAGITVPGQMEFLIGWDDPILEATVPSLAHYRFDGQKMGKQIGSLLLKQLDASVSKTQDVPILPEFSPGDSLSNGNRS
ncbi:LacI family transcriptional regulator [Haloferula luteola]|uniref:LacI family transcriptional regulator n=1 Tax=Haloferula luteola TaxID=595692 RepID=A0A840V7D3_9BACT|nr:substrate-binding domain-containing protein [Haloferula luteola]MBB5351494.1 LacI family transcriptional regulator [Haloferula luteola]